MQNYMIAWLAVELWEHFPNQRILIGAAKYMDFTPLDFYVSSKRISLLNSLIFGSISNGYEILSINLNLLPIVCVVVTTADQKEYYGEQARFSSENQAVLPIGCPSDLFFISSFEFTSIKSVFSAISSYDYFCWKASTRNNSRRSPHFDARK